MMLKTKVKEKMLKKEERPEYESLKIMATAQSHKLLTTELLFQKTEIHFILFNSLMCLHLLVNASEIQLNPMNVFNSVKNSDQNIQSSKKLYLYLIANFTLFHPERNPYVISRMNV